VEQKLCLNIFPLSVNERESDLLSSCQPTDFSAVGLQLWVAAALLKHKFVGEKISKSKLGLVL
jgi:hypothetical protein